jgi:hypothetical protein
VTTSTRWVILLLFASTLSVAQSTTERNFSVPVSAIQSALKKLPGGTSGPLPLLDGFVVAGAKSLQGFKRPYYQCTARVTAGSSGSVVHVTAKITAWNSDPAHSGYEVLQSNGRIESDLLDRLQEALSENASAKSPEAAASAVGAPTSKSASVPEISAPMPQLPRASSAHVATPTSPADPALAQQEKGLEDLLQNQSHPTNLIAVKQDQAPVLQEPSSDAKVLFLASAEDEFEILDINPEWVHVRISGLSRGWLRRSMVDVLDGSELIGGNSGDTLIQAQVSGTPASSKLFSVSGEEEGSFPADWAPLKGKSVKIISIQQAPGTGRITSPQDKMRFAENLFRSEDPAKSAAGLVLIFDAEDGGMVAATRAVLDLWRTGALSEQSFWKQCYLDPPEILGSNSGNN